MESESNILTRSFQDLFTGKMIKYSILPFVFSILIMYLLFFVVAGFGLDALGSVDVSSTETTMQDGIPHTESFTSTLEGTAIIKFLYFCSTYSYWLYDSNDLKRDTKTSLQ